MTFMQQPENHLQLHLGVGKKRSNQHKFWPHFSGKTFRWVAIRATLNLRVIIFSAISGISKSKSHFFPQLRWNPMINGEGKLRSFERRRRILFPVYIRPPAAPSTEPECLIKIPLHFFVSLLSLSPRPSSTHIPMKEEEENIELFLFPAPEYNSLFPSIQFPFPCGSPF